LRAWYTSDWRNGLVYHRCDAYDGSNRSLAMADAFTPEQLKDIQGFSLAGFRKDHQELLFIRFPDAPSGRALLGRLGPRTANAWEVGQFNEVFSEIRHRTGEETICATWVGVLISAAGYQALGVAMSGLPQSEGTAAFIAGMAARAQQLGDTGPLDQPAAWLEPFRPAAGVHACVVIAADEESDLEEAMAKVGDEISATGCEVVYQERGNTLPGDQAGHEHFSFKDGISQPAIQGYDADPATNEPPAVAPGEFVLGYPNTAGSSVPVTGTLWTNGSFAAFRRLYQDVAGFRAQAVAGVPGSSPQLSPDQTAAAMVGRWTSGAPLELNATTDPGESGITNAFQYKANDDDGHLCPHFAHIRKANPRDETTPTPASDNPATHRMLRRGIPFGPPLPTGAQDDGAQRGLHFFCAVADLDRQFEFVQRQWLNNVNFPGGQPGPAPGTYSPPAQGTPDGPDPVVGEQTAGEECTLVQPSGQHAFSIMKQVVHVTAGEYFFIPSLAALSALAGGATQ
jgi:Dyp-type peroxidase family